MILAQIVLATTLTLTTFTSGSDDLKELRSFVHKLIENINARDGKAFHSKWHPQATLYSHKFFFAFDRAEVDASGLAEIWEDFFSRIDRIDFKETDFSVRRIGEVGMVWGSTRVIVHRKGSGSSVERLRVTLIFIRASGGWKLLSWPDSPAPE